MNRKEPATNQKSSAEPFSTDDKHDLSSPRTDNKSGGIGPSADSQSRSLSFVRTLLMGIAVFAAFIVFSGPVVPWQKPYFEISWGWADYEAKLRDPWLDLSKHSITPDKYSHLPKLNYRLTAPMLAWLLGLNARDYVVLSGFACFITGCAYVRLGWRITGDEMSALCTGLLFAGSAAASQSVRSITGHFDGLAYCLLALALLATRWPWVALATFFACWTDQRAFAVSPIIFLAHALRPSSDRSGRWFDFRQPACLGVIGGGLGWALTFVIALQFSGMSFRLEGVGIAMLIPNLHLMPPVIWGALEGGWLILFGALIVAWRAGQRLLPLTLGLFVVSYLISTFSTLDLSRSAGYLLPTTVLAIAIFRTGCPVPKLRVWLCVAAAISLLCPNFDIISQVHRFTVEPQWLTVLKSLRQL